MDSVATCRACGEESVVLDPVSGLKACEACGRVVDDAPILLSGDAAQYMGSGGASGGHYGGYGSAPYRAPHGYKPSDWAEKKKRLAMEKVAHITSVLRLPVEKVDDVKHLLTLFSEEGWGIGRWIDILVAACVYIVVRQSRLPLTLVEVSEVVSCPPAELCRMFNRVLHTLEITLPDTDPAIFLERAITSLSAFESMTRNSRRDMTKHGLLLLEYSQEWCLTTGRHSLPVVAAIILILAESSKVKLGAAEVCRELQANQTRTSIRSRELKQALVGFAQRLPWGRDISIKTLPRHLPFLLKYLDINSKPKAKSAATNPKGSAGRQGKLSVEKAAISSAADCSAASLRHAPCHGTESAVEVRAGDSGASSSSVEGDGSRKRKHEDLLREASAQQEGVHKSSRCGGEHALWDGLPPAFHASREARERRQVKIAAAKERIAASKRGLLNELIIVGTNEVATCSEPGGTEHARERPGLDREDLLIEHLILNGTNEREIEDGYYRTLLAATSNADSHCFSDENLSQYLRSAAEVAFLEGLEEGKT